MKNNNLFSKYDTHLDEAISLLKDAQNVTIVRDKISNSISLDSEAEGIKFLIQTTNNSFYIEDVLENISYQYIAEPFGEICIIEKNGEDIFETTYIKEKTGAIELIETVSVVTAADGNEKIIICEQKDIEYDECENEEEYDEADNEVDDEEEYEEYDEADNEVDDDEEYTKEDLYAEYQVRINGDVISEEQAKSYIDYAFERTIILENDSEDRAIQYIELMEAIKFKIKQIKDDIKAKNLEER